MTPEPAAEKGFKIERLYYTLDGEAGRPREGQAEPALRRGAEDHRAASRSSAASSSPTICRRASRSTIRGSSRPATPARWPGSRTPRSRSTPNSATTASARRSNASRAIRSVFTRRLCGARGFARPLRAAAGLCRGHVPARPLRPHRDRHDRGDGEVMNERRHTVVHYRLRWRTSRRCVAPYRTGQGCRRVLVAALAARGISCASASLVGAAWWVRLARAGTARGRHRRYSTLVVDRDGRLLRAYATAEGRWRLPATVERGRSALHRMLLAYEDKRFRDASRRRSAGACCARSWQFADATAASSPAVRR